MPEVSDPTPSEHEPRDNRTCSVVSVKRIRSVVGKSTKSKDRAQQGEGAAEGRFDNWGEVVTRQPYRKVRLDHLLSKEIEQKFIHCLVINEHCWKSRRADCKLACKAEWMRRQIGRTTLARRSEADSSELENKVQCGLYNFTFLVAMRLGETPVHIPNTMVKT